MQLKIMICDECGRFMGAGPYKLLCLTDSLGSLRQAALEMGMSYSKAHALIKRLESAVQRQILRSHSGGAAGGGAELTDFGRKMLQEYTLMERRLQREAALAFENFCVNLDFSMQEEAVSEEV